MAEARIITTGKHWQQNITAYYGAQFNRNGLIVAQESIAAKFCRLKRLGARFD